MITPRQAEVLRFISTYQRENGCSPSYDEIADKMGLRSKSGITRLVNSMVERGVLARPLGRSARSLVLTDQGRALVD